MDILLVPNEVSIIGRCPYQVVNFSISYLKGVLPPSVTNRSLVILIILVNAPQATSEGADLTLNVQ